MNGYIPKNIPSIHHDRHAATVKWHRLKYCRDADTDSSRDLYNFEPVLVDVPRAHGQRTQPGSIDFSPAVSWVSCLCCAVLCCAMAPMSFAWCMRIFLALPSALTLAMAQRQSGISLPIRFRFCFPYQLTQFRNRVTSVLFIYHTSTCTEHCARPQYGPFMKDHKHGLFGWQKENKQNKQNKPMWVVRHTLRSVYNIFYSVFGKVL